MTLIALHYSAGRFRCYADSKISFGESNSLKKYCKVLSLPLIYRQTIGGKVITKSHNFGMGICGNLAAATAVYTIASGIFQSLHAHGESNAPELSHLMNFLLKIGRDVFEDICILGNSGLFGFIVFGFDITSKKPFVYKYGTVFDKNKQKIDLYNAECEVIENGVYLLGSGEEKFKEAMERGQKNHAHFADVFFQFVRSGEEPTVGGFPQLLIATQDGVTIEPVLIGDETGNARLIHSGINVDGYNTVGKYMIGLNIEGFNMEIAHRRAALKNAGYNPDDPNISVGEMNQAMLQFMIKIESRHGTKIDKIGTITVSRPRAIKDGKYYSYICRKCRTWHPIIKHEFQEGYQPFRSDLKFQILCNTCNETFIENATNFQIKSVL